MQLERESAVSKGRPRRPSGWQRETDAQMDVVVAGEGLVVLQRGTD